MKQKISSAVRDKPGKPASCGLSGTSAGYSRCLLVLVDALSHFLAEPARLDVFHEQRTGAIFLAKRFVKEIENTQARIETHEINHLEWTHGMIQTELERLVDIAGARYAFLQHEECFVTDDCIDSGCDEARRFLHFHGFFAHLLR